jgi:hypothetical protein
LGPSFSPLPGGSHRNRPQPQRPRLATGKRASGRGRKSGSEEQKPTARAPTLGDQIHRHAPREFACDRLERLTHEPHPTLLRWPACHPTKTPAQPHRLGLRSMPRLFPGAHRTPDPFLVVSTLDKYLPTFREKVASAALEGAVQARKQRNAASEGTLPPPLPGQPRQCPGCVSATARSKEPHSESKDSIREKAHPSDPTPPRSALPRDPHPQPHEASFLRHWSK